MEGRRETGCAYLYGVIAIGVVYQEMFFENGELCLKGLFKNIKNVPMLAFDLHDSGISFQSRASVFFRSSK